MGRKARFLSPSSEVRPVLYHAVDRINGRLFLLDREAKRKFIQLMRMHEAYTGVRVLSYVVMDNHFHLLLEVPPKKKGDPIPMSDGEFLKRLKAFNSVAYYRDIEQMMTKLRKEGANKAAEELKGKHTCRMHDLSCFMQGLKRRFSQWFNKTHNRTGTLWEGRFKSMIVQDGYAARVMSAYIDLNPVRAGMVTRPEDYRFCSYGEAMKPKPDKWRVLAREGLCRVMQLNRETSGRISPLKSNVVWEESGSEWYRTMLFSDGEEVFVSRPAQGIERVLVRKGFKREEVEKVLSRGGKLSFGETLRCKVRYLSDGMVFGTGDFVNGIFSKSKARFGGKRTSGARTMREVGWKERDTRLYTMRALKKNAVE